MSYYPEVTIEIKLSGTWTDVSTDVVPPITGQEGMMDSSPLSRVAEPGYLNFFLDNSARNSGSTQGYYTPGGTNVRTGFQHGAEVRMTFSFEGLERVLFYGRIPPDGIKVMPGKFDEQVVRVTALDWMAQAENHQISLPSFAEDKTAAEVVALVVANMPIAPQSTNYRTCQDTFPFVFDTVRDKETAIKEIIKAVVSEWGYCYLTHEDSGETLTVEGRALRAAASADVVSTAVDESDFLLLETGDYLLLETGDKLILHQTQSAVFADLFIEQSPPDYGGEIANKVYAKTYPRQVDAAATTVLFTLQEPFSLDPGESKTNYLGRYRDPTGGLADVSGRDMVTPVSGTDYAAFANSDGTGANYTSDLSITAEYGTEAVNYSNIQNTGSNTLWVTTLQARGKGVYLYDPVQAFFSDTASIDLHGTYPYTVDLKYQNNPVLGEAFAQKVLSTRKDPTARPEPPVMCANVDSLNLHSFMSLDIGSAIQWSESVTDINGIYFIHGKKYRIEENNVIYWQPTLMASSDDVYWLLETEGASELEETTFIGF